MGDHTDEINIRKDKITSGVENLGGPCHRLFISSKRARRIAQCTSHGETNAQLTCSQMAHMVALRYTESFTNDTFKRYNLRALMTIQDHAKYILPIDTVTDCYDLWELCCGLKGIPIDKTQRLSILGLREDRMTGRIRYMIHVNTENMIMDGLTKLGTFPQLMLLMTTGIIRIDNYKNKPCTIRKSSKREITTEEELLKEEEMSIESIKTNHQATSKTDKTRTSKCKKVRFSNNNEYWYPEY